MMFILLIGFLSAVEASEFIGGIRQAIGITRLREERLECSILALVMYDCSGCQRQP